MRITISSLSDGEASVLQKQADENNSQPGREIQQTPKTCILDELERFAGDFLASLRVKYADGEKRRVLDAIEDPEKLSAALVAIGQ